MPCIRRKLNSTAEGVLRGDHSCLSYALIDYLVHNSCFPHLFFSHQNIFLIHLDLDFGVDSARRLSARAPLIRSSDPVPWRPCLSQINMAYVWHDSDGRRVIISLLAVAGIMSRPDTWSIWWMSTSQKIARLTAASHHTHIAITVHYFFGALGSGPSAQQNEPDATD